MEKTAGQKNRIFRNIVLVSLVAVGAVSFLSLPVITHSADAPTTPATTPIVAPTTVAPAVTTPASTEVATQQAGGFTQPMPGASGGGLMSFLFNIAYTTIGKIFFFIGYLIAFVMAIVVAVEAWLVGVILNINAGVFNSAIVQVGFSASLSIANLGFIFGIIIIAIATILRSQTYGIKQIFWKLVVMAILVNFGLVIMGAIFNFSNQFTNYFLQCIDPSGGGCQGTQNGLDSMNHFASSLAGAFNPQKNFAAVNQLNASTTGTSMTGDSSVFGNFGSDIGKMLVPIFSVFFIAAALIVIVITLAAFVIMLLIRYVYIAILAVLLPFAWMLWVFPKTKDKFDKWWSEFIRWTFFAPIVLFFLWLALVTASGLSSNATGTQSFAQYTSNSNIIWAALSNFLSNLITPLLQNLLNEIVLVGLMVGGMIAANSMSITGAGFVVNGAKKIGSNIGGKARGYAWGQTKKAARATYQKAGGEQLNRRLQTSRIPGVSVLGRGMATATEAGGKKLVNQAMAEARGKDSGRLALELQGAMGKEKQFAYLEELRKRGDLDELKNKTIDGKSLEDFMDGNGKAIQQYGQGSLSGDIDTAIVSNKTMRDAQKQIETQGQGPDSQFKFIERNWATGKDEEKTMTAQEALGYSTKKFVGGLDASKVPQINMKMTFANKPDGTPTEMTTAIMESLAEDQPRLVPNMMSRMKGAEFKNFTVNYKKVLTDKIATLGEDNKELDKLDRAVEEARNNVNNALGATIRKDSEEKLAAAVKKRTEFVGPAQKFKNALKSLDQSIANLDINGAYQQPVMASTIPPPSPPPKT